MERTCRSCGTANPEAARFCMSCASPLGDDAPEPVEERRLVTILFVDLVGFTERSDRADPEDVRRTLVPFHRRVKADIERFGGTLDKFIGDAAMGVFGAPVAHEDDPERAVRAAMAILRSMDDLARDDPSVAVRVAVNTGDAVVAQGSGPQIGEAVAGDVVNTASRMQSVAPRGGIVVGPLTRRATAHRFDFEELPPVQVKGKREPLVVWRLAGERAAPSPGPSAAPMVGRAGELARLERLVADCEAASEPRVVAIVAEPGMGKSRLLQELRGRLGDRAGWVSGACLPYGEEMAFRPLADVLRGAIGVPAGADAEDVRAAVARAVAGAAPGDDQAWLLARLSTLLVPEGQAAGAHSSVAPEEWGAVAARVLADAATRRPVVAVVEDAHWADPALRMTIRSLATSLAGRSVLLVMTSRPGPGDEASDWVEPSVAADTLRLAALRPDETVALLDATGLPERDRDAVLARAGGSPLFAIELARMLADAPGPDRDTPGGGEAVPETLQAVIGARLDAVPADLRGVVQDAAVVGASFWPEALAEPCGRTEAMVDGAVEELVGRGVIVAEGRSRLPGHRELSFAHALYREVAYGRLPRLARSRRHLAAGEWLASVVGERPGELAGAIANHFARAAELAAEAGAGDERGRAVGPAVRWLLVAADDTARIDELAARALYERALALAPEATHERARALIGSGLMGRRSGTLAGREVLERFEQALALERALGDPLAVGSALVRVGSQLGALGEVARSREALAEAVEVLSGPPPGRELARALAFRAEDEMFAGRTGASLELADRALALAREVGADDAAIVALHIRGDARCSSGDPGGLDDLREATALSERAGSAADLVTSVTYEGEWAAAFEGPGAALRHLERALELGEARGAASQVQWTVATAAWSLLEAGEWEVAFRRCEDLLSRGRDHLDVTVFAVARTVRAAVLVLAGRADLAGTPDDLLEPARAAEEVQALAPALVVAALLAHALGDDPAARRHLAELDDVTRGLAPEHRGAHLADAVRVAVAAGDVPLAERLVATTEATTVRDALNLDTARAILSEARGDHRAAAAGFADVAERWGSFGHPRQRAEALLGSARAVRDRDPDRAAAAEAEAGAILSRLGRPRLPTPPG